MKEKLPKVLIDNRQKKRKINLTRVVQATSRILDILGEKDKELSLSFVTNRAIASLNKRYLSSSRVTDVLAFPMYDTDVLGDVVISVERAYSQAKAWNEPFQKEIMRLIIHGILHLIGYKDKRKNDRIKMFKKQEEILSLIYETP